MCVVQTTPRRWTAAEIDLIDETADRLWSAVQRGRAEVALRDSEERFTQFAASSSDALWIRDAATLAMEYTSPAIQPIYGIGPDAILGDVARWTTLIVPQDRAIACTHIERAQAGEAVVHEFRILRPSDGEERWIRNTDFPLFGVDGRVQRIGGIAEDITEAKRATERMSVLIKELQHRTRNIMSVVRALADRTLRSATDLADFKTRYGERLTALARVQAHLSRLDQGQRITADELIRNEVAVHNGDVGRIMLQGPADLELGHLTIQALSLALHELATNAVKYGAFSQPRGRLEIVWSLAHLDDSDRPWLQVDWRERDVVLPGADVHSHAAGSGAGRDLIERALPYQFDARTTFVIENDGVHCMIALPRAEL